MLEDVRVTEVAMSAPSALGDATWVISGPVPSGRNPALANLHVGNPRAPAEEASRLHRHWNRGKRSLTIDLRHQPGRPCSKSWSGGRMSSSRGYAPVR